MSYAGLKNGHTVGKIGNDGQLLELEDGSRWQIYEGFASRTNGWSGGEMIKVKQNKNPEYPYTLVNIHKNEQVEAMCLDGGRE